MHRGRDTREELQRSLTDGQESRELKVHENND